MSAQQASLMPLPAPRRTQPHRTEADLIALLRKRHVRVGNGGAGEYAFLTQVRNAAAFDATRTLDVVTLSLWPSRGMELHGYEVKSSRADWVRERDNPAKAETFIRRLDRFTLLVADAAMVQPGELPPTWGLMAPKGDRLVTVVAAPKLPRTPEEQRVSRSWLVCLLRAAGAVPTPDRGEVEAERRAGVEQGRSLAQRELDQLRGAVGNLRESLDAEAAIRADLFAALGLRDAASYYQAHLELARIAVAVRAVRSGDAEVERAAARLREQLRAVEEIAARLRAAVGEAAP